MKPKLYRYQYHAILLLFCLTGIFLPGILERAAGTASYPSLAIAVVIGILLIVLYALAFRSEGGFCAIAQRRLGKLAGGIAAGIYIVYFLLIAIELFCFYGLYISGNTAPFFYLAPIAAAVIFSADKSITVLGRTAIIFAPILLVFAVIPVIAGVIEGDFKNFVPFAMLSWDELGKIALSIAALEIGQVIAVTAISPKEYRSAKNTLPAVLIASAVVILIAVTAILIDGQTPLINRLSYYSFSASGDFSELKILAAFVLFFCTAFRLSICLRAAAVTTGELLRMKDSRYIVPAYGVLLFAGSVAFSGNIGAMAEYLLKIVPYVSAVPMIVLPLLLVIFRGKERKA